MLENVGIYHYYQEKSSRSEEPADNLGKTLHAIIVVSPLVMMLVGPDDRVIDWNPAAERFFRLDKKGACELPNPANPGEKQGEFQSLLARALFGIEPTGWGKKLLRVCGGQDLSG